MKPVRTSQTFEIVRYRDQYDLYLVAIAGRHIISKILLSTFLTKDQAKAARDQVVEALNAPF